MHLSLSCFRSSDTSRVKAATIAYCFLPALWGLLMVLSLIKNGCCSGFMKFLVILGLTWMLIVWFIAGVLFFGG